MGSKRSIYRAMTDEELLEHLEALFLAWRFSDGLDGPLERHWSLVWFELQHRGLTYEWPET